jgi:hypothetical protein
MTTLFRPVGLEELSLIWDSGMRQFPPRLHDARYLDGNFGPDFPSGLRGLGRNSSTSEPPQQGLTFDRQSLEAPLPDNWRDTIWH